jgi:hypothetical protein
MEEDPLSPMMRMMMMLMLMMMRVMMRIVILCGCLYFPADKQIKHMAMLRIPICLTWITDR